MNRKEKRKLEKIGVPKSQIQNLYRQKVYEAGAEEGTRHSYKMILLMCAYIARIHFDLKQGELGDFMDRLLKCIDSFRTGQLSKSDIDLIADECREYGFDIEGFN